MKKSSVIVVLLVLISAIYSAGWYFYANYVKDYMVSKIDMFFAETQIGTFEYEDVSVSGFPTKVDVTFSNAKSKIKSGELYKMAAKDSAKYLSEEEKSKIEKIDWVDEISREGSFTVSTNLLANDFNIKTSGDLYYKSLINGQEFPFVIKGKPAKFKITFAESPIFIERNNPDMDAEKLVEKLFQNLQHFRYSQGENKGYNSETDELLYSTKSVLFLYDLKPKGSNTAKVELKMHSTDVKFEKAYEDMLAQIFKEFSTDAFPYKYFSRKGSMNSDIHFIYTGGALINNSKFNKKPSFTLEMPKFVFYDDLSKVHGSGMLEIMHENNKLVSTKVKYDGKLQYDEKWYDYLISDLKSYKDEMYSEVKKGNTEAAMSELDKIPGDVKATISMLQSDEEMLFSAITVLDNIEKVIPKFHEWGTIINKVDIDYNAKAEDGKKLDVKNFDFIFGPKDSQIGYTVSGTAQQVTMRKHVDFSISLLSYQKLINDLFSYSKGLIKLGEKVTRETSPIHFKDGVERAVQKFLVNISNEQNKNNKNLSITIKMDEKNPMPMIGSKSFFEVVGMASQNLAPYFQVDPSSIGGVMGGGRMGNSSSGGRLGSQRDKRRSSITGSDNSQ
jgi:hypothetical protein